MPVMMVKRTEQNSRHINNAYGLRTVIVRRYMNTYNEQNFDTKTDPIHTNAYVNCEETQSVHLKPTIKQWRVSGQNRPKTVD